MQLAARLPRVRLGPGAKKLLADTGAALAFACLGRAALPGGLSPFAAAGCACVYITALPVPAALGCLAGALSVRAFGPAAACLFIIAGVWALGQLGLADKPENIYILLGCAQTLALLLDMPAALYDLMMGGFCVLAALLLCGVYCAGVRALRRHKLTEDGLTAACVLAGSFVLGLSGAELYGVRPGVLLVSLAVLLAGYSGGAGIGAGTGAALGVMLSPGGAEYIAYFTLLGLASGAFRQMGPLLSPFAGLLAAAVYAVYSRDSLQTLANVALSAGAFALLPEGFKKRCSRLLSGRKARREYPERQRLAAQEQLAAFSAVFREMGGIFSQPVQPGGPFQAELSQLRPVCTGCAAENRCWSGEGRVISALEGVLSGEEPPFFLQRCPRLDRLTGIAGVLERSAQSQRAQNRRTLDAQALAGRQLAGAADVMEALAGRLSGGAAFDEQLEKKLQNALDMAGCSAREVSAQLDSGRLSITITCEHGGHDVQCAEQCTGAALKAAAAVSGKKLRLAHRDCARCRFVYEQAHTLFLQTGCAQSAVQPPCGDSVLSEGLPGGHLLCICDGMGTGARAHVESSAAVALAGRLFAAGVGRDIAIEAVNRLLLLRGGDEMYSTLDICRVDLITGSAELCKLGAPPAYWLTSDGVRALAAETLPAGILDAAQPQVYGIRLSPGDWLVLMSDGAHDALEDPALTVSRFACGDAQATADLILRQALENGASDDATVLAARVLAS